MDPYVGQIIVAGFNTIPRGWAQCAGQLLPISRNTALFSLLGVQFGGDGKVTFALPNLQGNCAVGAGQAPGLSAYSIGQTGGTQQVSLLSTQLPPHNHTVGASGSRPNASSPGGNSLAPSGGLTIYNDLNPPPTLVAMSPQTTLPVGQNQPHNNMMPYLTLNWLIALEGVYPSRP